MNFQNELRSAKRLVREWVLAHFSDQQLANVTAFNADSRMSFRDPCGCLMGVTFSNRLHTSDEGCDREHYKQACRLDQAQSGRFARLLPTSTMGKTERAYMLLGYSSSFASCFGDDLLRSRRMSALLRAEMRRRARLTKVFHEEVELLQL